MIAAVLTLGWGCSKSDGDEESVPANPDTEQDGGTTYYNRTWHKVDFDKDWHVSFTAGNESKPDWKAPSAQDYETWMIYQLTLPENFTYWASADDMMAVFINGQVRAVASPAYDTYLDEGQPRNKYILKIIGDYEDSKNETVFTYKYYNAKLKQVLTNEMYDRFIPELVKGVDAPFIPEGYSGNIPWTVQTTIEMILPDDIFHRANIVGVFVGDECRGLVSVSEKRLFFNVFSNVVGETATIYAYNENVGATKLTPEVKLNGGFTRVTIDEVNTDK